MQLNQITVLEKFRPQLTSDKEDEREFAYASFAALGYEALALKIIQTKQDTAGRAVAESIKESGSTTDRAQAALALETIPARVFLQIADESQRPTAATVSEALRRSGYVVPGIENVAGKATSPKATTVRFFNEEDRPAAEAIVAVLKSTGIRDAVEQNVTRFKVRPGSIEVWFPASAG